MLNLDLSVECYMIQQERTVLQTVAILDQVVSSKNVNYIMLLYSIKCLPRVKPIRV